MATAFLDYLEKAKLQFPREGAPEAVWGGRLLCGWRWLCRRENRPADLPPGDPNGDKAEAEQWRNRATAARDMARGYGSWASTMSAADLENGFLAIHGRAPSGLPFKA